MANDMQSKIASFRGRFQMEGPIEYEQCQTIYFVEDGGNAFHLRRFKSKENATALLHVLKTNWHYTFPRLSPVFEVEGQDDYFLAFEKLGMSLENFVKQHKNLFSNRHLISSLYQDILIDLIRLCQHLETLKVKPRLSLTNIFVLRNSNGNYNDPLHLTIVDFDYADGLNMNWVGLATLVEQINEACGYNSYGSLEMQTFLIGIKTAYKNFFNNLYNQPLLWTLEERRSFTCDFWEVISFTETTIYHLKQIFTKDPTRWEEEFRKDKKLSKLKDEMKAADVAYKMGIMRKNESGSGTRMSSTLNVTHTKKLDNATRDCLCLIRQSYAHINQRKKHLRDPDLQCEEQLQILFEYAFPCHILELRNNAISIEGTLLEELMPRSPKLMYKKHQPRQSMIR